MPKMLYLPNPKGNVRSLRSLPSSVRNLSGLKLWGSPHKSTSVFSPSKLVITIVSLATSKPERVVLFIALCNTLNGVSVSYLSDSRIVASIYGKLKHF